ncbi:PHD finger-like domain-containing protein 5A [Diaphorina citri]|uniref:PHD finger-like domain-containing protein 5A n=1 Tax=Diaphorina citri TaxID=121845 RepID=A0A3Q0J4T1_DIACI|nr:PHD finger-like domain-containing protein 5A [Diaphorina citri]
MSPFGITGILVILSLPQRVKAIGRLCEKCDGKCVICDSYVRPCTLVRICDECNYGSYQGRCVICGGPGVSDAYYCKECTIQEKDVSTVEPQFYELIGTKGCS